MKRLIVLVTLMASSVYGADSPTVIGKVKNGAGGEILFTNTTTDSCKNQNARFVYSTSSQGYVQTGCWSLVDNYVFVKWDDDGAVRMYPVEKVELSDWVIADMNKKNNKPAGKQL